MSALEGVKVVEFTSYVSGPYAGMLLAAFRASAARTQRKLETRALRGIGVAFPLRHSQFKLIQISTKKNKRE